MIIDDDDELPTPLSSLENVMDAGKLVQPIGDVLWDNSIFIRPIHKNRTAIP